MSEYSLHQTLPTGTLLILCMIIALCMGLPAKSIAQDVQLARADYLQGLGLDTEAHALEEQLRAELDERRLLLPGADLEQMASFFAFVLTLHGVTAEKAMRLQAGGVDVMHAITANNRPLMEQALLTDLVVVAEVTKIQTTPSAADGYRSSVHAVVLRHLKGQAVSDTVIVRQRSTPDSPNERDLNAVVGNTYLLLLTNGMYRFSLARRGETVEAISEETLARHFVLYRWYEMKNDRLLWDGYSKRDTRRALREIQWLDELLESL